jgi:hypothetical protein
VARVYAGILGPLALATSLADGLVHGRHPEAVLFTAWVSLLVFSAVGYVAGWIAEKTVGESVGSVVSAELIQRASVDAPGTAATAIQPENR